MNLKLKQMRVAAGLSQEDMATKLGIKKTRYGSWERGERMLSLAQAYDCAEILGCSLDELAGRNAPGRRFFVPGQAELNECFEACTDANRVTVIEVARAMRDRSGGTAERGPMEAEVEHRRAG